MLPAALLLATALSALEYAFEPRRTIATLANAAEDLSLPSRETFDARAGTSARLYVSRLNDDCGADCAVLLYAHGGFLLEGSRYQASPLVLWMANAHRLLVYSVEYRMASQGASFDDAVDDVAVAAAWVKRRHPDRPLVLAGASAGGSLVLALARRAPPLAALAVVDSAPVCDATYAAQAADDAWTRWLVDDVGVASPAEVLAWPRRCDEAASPLRVPTVVLHSAQDLLVPVAQAEALRGRPNATVCVARGGTHMVALSAACREVLRGALADAGVVAETRAYDGWSADVRARLEYAAYALLPWVPTPLVTVYLCLVRTDPALTALLGCRA
jgi:acetyl esterase